MKTNIPNKISPFRSDHDGTKKRKWISQKELSEIKADGFSVQNRSNKNGIKGYSTITTESYANGSRRIVVSYRENNVTEESAKETLRLRKQKPKSNVKEHPYADIFRSQKKK